MESGDDPSATEGVDLPPLERDADQAKEGWTLFPGCDSDRVPAVRLAVSRWLARGVYRRIKCVSGSYVFVHVAEVPEAADAEAALRIMKKYTDSNAAAPSEIMWSCGRELLFHDELAVYPSELVTTPHGAHTGVMLCASCAHLGERVKIEERLNNITNACLDAGEPTGWMLGRARSCRFEIKEASPVPVPDVQHDA